MLICSGKLYEQISPVWWKAAVFETSLIRFSVSKWIESGALQCASSFFICLKQQLGQKLCSVLE